MSHEKIMTISLVPKNLFGAYSVILTKDGAEWMLGSIRADQGYWNYSSSIGNFGKCDTKEEAIEILTQEFSK